MQEMMDKHSAKFIVIPLLLLPPYPALRFIKLADISETILISVMAQFLFELGLIKVKTGNTEVRGVRRIFFKYFSKNMSRFVHFLYETDNLIDLVGNNIPVLVLMTSASRCLLLAFVGNILQLFFRLFVTSMLCVSNVQFETINFI